MQDKKKYKDKYYGWLIPEYDEIMLFSTAVLTFLFFAGSGEFRVLYFKLFSTEDGSASIFLFFVWIGCALSFYHLFSKRIKSEFEKGFMLLFMVSINLFSSIAVISYVFDTESNLLFLILPILNFLAALAAFYLHWDRPNNIDGSVSNVNTNLLQIILITLFLSLLYWLSEVFYRNHWTITFSIHLIFTPFFAKLLRAFKK